ncbi:HAD family hydrolase [Thermotoga sp. KOL6]|uniref:HAD family hydrolase n=1 Tax=Thermotoga sp. KOL6 TaxID=126741 RepID=UPI000C75AF5F|nr:HAD family hydrolase [Thermotoga sp. KOL6]PLV60085.1 HAD family hydrolase [Thermotoga sp. KOL6]
MKVFLFDYDGTLAVDNGFAESYFKSLALFFEKEDVFVSKQLILECVEYITKNPNGFTNMERFTKCLEKKTGKIASEWERIFMEFYSGEFFDTLKGTLKPIGKVLELLKERKKEGKIVLATNPVFPKLAIIKRLNWIGLSESDFDLITDMENFHFCKPDPRYYLEICEKLNASPEDCIMYGDDDVNDGVCEKIGMKFFNVRSF